MLKFFWHTICKISAILSRVYWVNWELNARTHNCWQISLSIELCWQILVLFILSTMSSINLQPWARPSRSIWVVSCYRRNFLTHWGRETHICVGKLTIIGSDNGLSPARRQAIIWTNAGILLIGPLGTNFNEILIEIHIFSVKKMHLKMSSAKWRPFCLGPNVLTHCLVTSYGDMNLRHYWPS